MLRLGVNIDHVATLREARYRGWKKGLPPEPRVLDAACACARAGVSGITVHLREDRRHIQDADVRALRRAFKHGLNLEMAVTEAMVRYALALRPDEVCLVPENRREVTTEGGLDLLVHKDKTARSIACLKKAGIWVSVFIDPRERQVRAAASMGADAVELHTGAYANAVGVKAVQAELTRQKKAARLAHELGLQVNAGHGLHYDNLARYVRAVPHLHTLNIGHAIVARAVFEGLPRAVSAMLRLMKS